MHEKLLSKGNAIFRYPIPNPKSVETPSKVEYSQRKDRAHCFCCPIINRDAGLLVKPVAFAEPVEE
jgi:hypothetical protein